MCNEFGISHQILPIEDVDDGKIFKISIRIPMEFGWIEHVLFSVIKGPERSAFQLTHMKNEDGFAYFETTVKLKMRAIYFYYFSFEANGVFRFYKRTNETGENSIIFKECWKMSVNFNVPDWAKGKIMYHIFVDRYRRGSKDEMEPMPRRIIHKSWDDKVVLGPDKDGNWNIDFFGGDLKGIEETLGYLKKLGVSIIYLSPICRSQSNHRYDTGNYEEVDPYVGSNADLKSLCNKAHEKGMQVILDGVFNHTGNDSLYFNQYGTYEIVGAYQSENSKYASFYPKPYWENGQKKYSYWWGIESLPVCNAYSPEWQNYIFGEGGVIDQWFALGIDGLRLDVADNLTDEFIEGIWKAVTRNKSDGFIIGEVWKNPMMENRGYIVSGKGMHTVMNYQLVSSLIRYFKYADANALKNTLSEILTMYPKDTILTLMNFTSTHDISRAIEIFSCDEFNSNYDRWPWDLLKDNLENDAKLEWIREHKLSWEKYKQGRQIYQLYVLALTFLPGIVSIFYGDEVGLQGIGNLYNRAPYPWKKRDKKLLKFFRHMGNIRKDNAFMETADLKVIEVDSRKFVFERYNDTEKIVVAINRTQDIIEWKLPEQYEVSDVIYSLRNSTTTILKPFGAIAIKVKTN
jgi:glycosidase